MKTKPLSKPIKFLFYIITICIKRKEDISNDKIGSNTEEGGDIDWQEQCIKISFESMK